MPKQNSDYDIKDFKDGAQLKERACTDMCCILFSIIFIIIWVVVASVAFNLGKPSRILLPENFRGELCGDTDTELEDYKYMYLPRPSRRNYGICVNEACPSVGDYICNNDPEDLVNNSIVRNDYYNHKAAEYTAGASALLECTISDCSATTKLAAERYIGLLKKQEEYKCFLVFYSTSPTLKRCYPFETVNDNATLAELAGESVSAITGIADSIGAGDFFRRGYGEVEQARWIILISCFTCCFLAVIWIFLLRCLLAPIVYLCILLILGVLIAIGFFAKLMADDLENVKLPGDTATDDQVKMWRAIQYIFWGLACVYLVVMIYLLKRIRIAILIIKQGTKAFLNNKGLILIPPIVLVLLAGWIVWFIYVSLYIQTIGEVTADDFTQQANKTFGTDVYNAAVAGLDAANNTLFDLNITNENTTSFNSSTWTTEDIVKIMHGVNLFGFIWSAWFCLEFGFFIMAMTTTAWYFSATTEQIVNAKEGNTNPATGEEWEEGMAKEKGTELGTLAWSICGAIRHIGTILWGSFCIAVITFVRVIFLFLEEEVFKPFAENPAVKCLLSVVKCCLAYIERVVKIISENGFVVCCIRKTGFCSSASEALSLLVANAIRVGTLNTMSTVAFFIVKLIIVGCNTAVAWALMREVPELTDGEVIESGLFPLVLIFLLSFVIASLFTSVLEGCTTTIMMCFLWDEDNLNGSFMNPSLSKLVGAFEHVEQARRQYEIAMKNANRAKYADKESAEPVK